MSLNVQFFTLWMMFISGWGLGVLFDMYRVSANEFHFPRWLIAVLDLLYWFLAAIIVFIILYESNKGELRIFVFVGLLLGAGCYYLILSTLMRKIMKSVILIIKKLSRLIIRILYLLVIVPVMALCKVFIIFLGFLAAISIFLYKFVVQCFYPLWKWIYHKFKGPMNK